MERSLVLVKPDGMRWGLAGTVLARLEEAGLKLVALRMLHMDREMAERHYGVHKDKPFFSDLVSYIISSPIVAAVFEGENAVERIREIMGATDPKKAVPGTIRADFGLDIERNTGHGSDSVENAVKEISLFFTAAEILEYDREG